MRNLLICIIILVFYNLLFPQHIINVELWSGSPINFKTPLFLRQKDQPAINIKAKYQSRPLDDPYYYIIRLGFKLKQSYWALQFLHHKLYLANPPNEVQHFEITHGYNILSLNKIYESRNVFFDIGIGIVFAHVESTIRNRSYSGENAGILKTGYFISGPSIIGGIGKKFYISDKLYIPANVQFTATYARVPISNGSASAPNIAIHLLIGMGYQL